MDKSPDAFRTISEVADILETPAHVLRFWESRFPQIRPVKRAGGRRYYRPADVALLTGIKRLLHDEGMTIRGVQKVLREQGVRHVSGMTGEDLSEESEQDAEAALEAALAANFGLIGDDDARQPAENAESATIFALETALNRKETAAENLGQEAEIISVFSSSAASSAPVAPAQSPYTQASLFENDLKSSGVGATPQDQTAVTPDASLATKRDLAAAGALSATADSHEKADDAAAAVAALLANTAFDPRVAAPAGQSFALGSAGRSLAPETALAPKTSPASETAGRAFGADTGVYLPPDTKQPEGAELAKTFGLTGDAVMVPPKPLAHLPLDAAHQVAPPTDTNLPKASLIARLHRLPQGVFAQNNAARGLRDSLQAMQARISNTAVASDTIR